MVGTISGIIINKRGADHDIALIKGATVNFSIIWGGKTPVDVTGFSAKIQVRNNPSDTDPVFEFTVANGRVNIGDTDGLISFEMPSAQSDLLTAGNYYYIMEVTDDQSNSHPVMSGRFRVKPGAT